VGRFYSRAELLEQRQRWKREGKTVVFTNGCYDLLHPGHIRLLEQARSLGDVLILALNSDASTRRAKGPARPVIPNGNARNWPWRSKPSMPSCCSTRIRRAS
jgi:cytidyltransferase-like protein